MAAVLDPRIFKAYDVRGLYGSRARRGGRVRDRPRLRRALRAPLDRGRTRHARLGAVDGGSGDGGRRGRRRRRPRPRDGRHRDGLLRGRRARARRRHLRHRLAQPEAVHGHEDRPRAARCPSAATRASRTSARGAQAGFGPVARRGEITPLDVWPGFVDKVLSFVDVDAIAPLRIVVDAANGMAGAMLPPVLERLPQVEVVRCYFDPDGTFPNHEPNPLLEENRALHRREDAEEGAALGVAYDGDADRCFFVDDTGEFVPGDFVTALLAEVMLGKSPGGTVLYDVRASWAVPRTIAAAGGTAIVNRVGHAFIKHRMREEHAIFAGEVSAHYYFRDFTQADTGVVPFLLMLELISKRGAEALRDPAAVPRAVLHHGRDQHAGRRRAARSCRRSRSATPPRAAAISHLDGDLRRLRHLALQRAAVEHRAAAPAQPRGAVRGGDDRPPRRARRPDPELSRVDDPLELGRAHRPAAAVPLLGADARLVLGHRRAGRRLLRPLPALLRPRAHRVPPPPRLAPDRGRRVRDARLARRVPRAGPLRRPARVLRPRQPDRPHERHVRGRRVQAARRRADGDGHPDGRPDRPRDAAARCRCPSSALRRGCAEFEGDASSTGSEPGRARRVCRRVVARQTGRPPRRDPSPLAVLVGTRTGDAIPCSRDACHPPIGVPRRAVGSAAQLVGWPMSEPYSVLQDPARSSRSPSPACSWKPLRRTLGIDAFGINAYTAPPGDHVVEEHTEETLGHQEAYVVIVGPRDVHARRRGDRRAAGHGRLHPRPVRAPARGRGRAGHDRARDRRRPRRAQPVGVGVVLRGRAATARAATTRRRSSCSPTRGSGSRTTPGCSTRRLLGGARRRHGRGDRLAAGRDRARSRRPSSGPRATPISTRSAGCPGRRV